MSIHLRLSALAVPAATLLGCGSASTPEDARATSSAVTAADDGTTSTTDPAPAPTHDTCDDYLACMDEGLAICASRCKAQFPVDGEDRARCVLDCNRNQAEYCGDRYRMTPLERLDCMLRKPADEPVGTPSAPSP